ncbi:MAG: transglycosylase SLT domain-containing protein [Betaproteobacteria bacterium]|nr:transglycosylase SLT domain-containing protein [Betaproteobacteria bacterium]
MNDAISPAGSSAGTMNRLFHATRTLFALIGMTAVTLVALPTPLDTVQRQIASVISTDSAGANYSAGTIQARDESEARAGREQRAVAEFLAKRYRVAEEAVAGIVTAAYRAGGEHRVDPLLILAVIAVESRFNPVAESVFGARGLMQVIPKFHVDKVASLGGQDALLEPSANIQVGAQILRQYLRRFGETETALQMYAGAFDDANSAYASKVLAERARIEQTLLRARRAA